MAYTGKNDMYVLLVLKILKTDAAQQQAETTAVIPLLHGLHGRQDLIRRKGRICGFQG